MNTMCNTLFRGWPPAIELDEVLVPEEVFAAHDEYNRYVIARTDTATWLCAPISDLALECVSTGRAELRSVFAHSLTGTIGRLTQRNGAAWTESTITCAELRDEDLPEAGVRLAWRARCA